MRATQVRFSHNRSCDIIGSSNLLLSDAFDVIRDSKDNVTLVDFSPLDAKYVDTLAFEWSDLSRDPEVFYRSMPLPLRLPCRATSD